MVFLFTKKLFLLLSIQLIWPFKCLILRILTFYEQLNARYTNLKQTNPFFGPSNFKSISFLNRLDHRALQPLILQENELLLTTDFVHKNQTLKIIKKMNKNQIRRDFFTRLLFWTIVLWWAALARAKAKIVRSQADIFA